MAMPVAVCNLRFAPAQADGVAQIKSRKIKIKDDAEKQMRVGLRWPCCLRRPVLLAFVVIRFMIVCTNSRLLDCEGVSDNRSSATRSQVRDAVCRSNRHTDKAGECRTARYRRSCQRGSTSSQRAE